MTLEHSKVRTVALLVLLVVTGCGVFNDRFTPPLRRAQAVLFVLSASVLAYTSVIGWRRRRRSPR